ncbi:acylneuraminate cytidylyltransferase family protein [Anaerostipes sp.]|uniref:acylneuraminate cytidylyltransferase family protein n=1 Tax=Anaerostipes sp. TaxID=1872530 RepID=UPI0025B89531|nr:acylneuraminate cytidylyltransferase family protein [Anaerostipes sp.]MBS7007255.1 acylneuraminate cytidylyltransferase family protein [Anaerostipes sp.]
MKVTAFVPMKLNNERLPGKNTKAFTNGRPLCCYILETLKEVIGIDEIYVYCSDEKIKEFLPENIHFLKRSRELDQSSTKINEVLKAFASEVASDIYVLAHATAPFLLVKTIEEGIRAVKSQGYDSAFSVLKQQDFFWKDGKPLNYSPECVVRTQDLKPYYRETTGLYIYTRQLIMKEGRRIGRHPYLIETTQAEAADINEPEDFLLADAIYNFCLKDREREKGYE